MNTYNIAEVKDLGQIKPNSLVNADCLEAMKYIPDKSIDLILCDLPYGKTACEWDTIIPFEPLWEQYNRIIKDNGAIVLFGTEPFSSKLRLSNLKMYRYDWIWVKERGTGFANSKKIPLKRHEIISVFYKKQPFYDYNDKKLDKPYWHALPIVKSDVDRGPIGKNIKKDGSRIYAYYEYSKKNSVLEFARATKGSLHPTQKPVALLEYLIKTYTKEGETVLDNCIGSGSTGVACVNTNRNFIGIELDEKYFEIAKERIFKKMEGINE